MRIVMDFERVYAIKDQPVAPRRWCLILSTPKGDSSQGYVLETSEEIGQAIYEWYRAAEELAAMKRSRGGKA